ncbi:MULTISPECIES: putative lipid II flippase FtsW [Brevibacterium]|uniref:Probable peptidoglycan glycosyltransferase FtsW n=1 Tax=Brevibacterium antiquum CNRZ 918 TaxID=1255637 RepID=A0A2H1HKV0_9MICO|nr:MULTISPECIES: putative lipid II flippase FtsW [Brevibacterium]SMX63496.1 cell division-specific peptidoglycan biosynthesis regulator FtsW [Brevibacterium antiquum CNRZ 918]HCG57507.1 putative lipid II flippase FtsW [Brevibacterium sp.]
MGRQTTAKSQSRRLRSTRSAEPAVGRAGDTKVAAKKAAAKPSAKSSTKSPPTKNTAGAKTTAATKRTAPKRTTGTKKTAAKKTAAKKTSGTGSARNGKQSTSVHTPHTTHAENQPRTGAARAMLASVRREFAKVSAYPLTTYYLILVSVLALTSLGLVMVLSASSITSYDGGAGSSFAYFNKQAGFVAMGIVLMVAATFVPLNWWFKLAWPALLLGVAMQAAVFFPGVGKATKGNANWIQFGGFQLQPSEFLKVALAVWLGAVLARKYGKMTTFSHAMIPVVPGIILAVGLVVGGNDLGTGLVLMAMALVCLFIGFFPWKYFLLLFGSLGAVAAFFVFSSQNRLQRITAALTGHADQTASDVTGQAWQSNHGLFSLASGGWLGVGLGASREKWSWLPEAHNDFIFAIIGEELGLLGSLAVILMFVALACGMVRVILRSKSRFVQVATAGLFAWLIGQAAINICVVTGLLPVIGLPLPFVSYGGSSIVASLLAVGVILSFARTEDGASAAIKVHKDRVRSSFAVLARKRKK